MSTNSSGHRKLSDSAGPAAAGEGYFSTLNLHFGVEIRDVQRAFRVIALQCHPDKAGANKELIERFQAASTAYQVLTGDGSRAAYMTMYRIRCHLHQCVHELRQPLAPFYVLAVRKKDTTGIEQPRVLTLDLLEGQLQNWKKDAPHKSMPLVDITDVKPTSSTSFTISFRDKANRPYRLSVDTPAQCTLYTSVLQAIVSGNTPSPRDDYSFPPPSLRKGFVEKGGKGGDWARRWIILGRSNLLIFRSADCERMVNALPLEPGVCSVKEGVDGSWTLTTAGRKVLFRNSKSSIATAWVEAIKKALATSPTESWLRTDSSLESDESTEALPARPSAAEGMLAKTRGGLKRQKSNLVRTEEDLRSLSQLEDDVSPLLLDTELEAAAERESINGATLGQDDEAAVMEVPPVSIKNAPAPISEEEAKTLPPLPSARSPHNGTRSSYTPRGSLSAMFGGIFRSGSDSQLSSSPAPMRASLGKEGSRPSQRAPSSPAQPLPDPTPPPPSPPVPPPAAASSVQPPVPISPAAVPAASSSKSSPSKSAKAAGDPSVAPATAPAEATTTGLGATTTGLGATIGRPTAVEVGRESSAQGRELRTAERVAGDAEWMARNVAGVMGRGQGMVRNFL